ncbi:MAG: hypothetical protein V4584_05815 [Verrucomicrobiota bacterium]
MRCEERGPVEVARGFLGGVGFLSLVSGRRNHIVQGAGFAGLKLDGIVQPLVPCLAVELTAGRHCVGTTRIVAATTASGFRVRLNNRRWTQDQVEQVERNYALMVKNIRDFCAATRNGWLEQQVSPDSCITYIPTGDELTITHLYKLHAQVPAEFIRDFLVREGILLQRSLKWGGQNINRVSSYAVRYGFVEIRPVRCEQATLPGADPADSYKIRYTTFFTQKTADLLEMGPDPMADTSRYIEQLYAKSQAGPPEGYTTITAPELQNIPPHPDADTAPGVDPEFPAPQTRRGL